VATASPTVTPVITAAAPTSTRPLAIAGMPWPLAVAVLGSAAVVVGLLWDISWHASIGRDSFWTPAHLAIYLGGLACGLSAGWVALATTFAGTPERRAETVCFWGFRAPLGAWVAIWGSSEFLLSRYARNWFFAADQWTYRARPGAWRHRYWLDGDGFGPRAAAVSLLLAVVSARLGLAWGGWLSRVRR